MVEARPSGTDGGSSQKYQGEDYDSIAAMTGQGLPVLMGDLLLSSPKRVAQATTNVPTIGDVAELFAESQRVPTGL